MRDLVWGLVSTQRLLDSNSGMMAMHGGNGQWRFKLTGWVYDMVIFFRRI